MCTEPGTLKCAGCKDVLYCSAECQQADWPTHKLLCKTFNNFQQRPAANMRRIIYFPVNGTKPEFMWRPLKPDDRSREFEDGRFDRVDMDEHMNKCVFKKSFTIQINAMNDKPLDYTMVLYYDDDFMDKFPHPNEAITAAANGKLAFLWGGPLYAVCGNGYDTMDIRSMKDMGMATFADLVAFLQEYRNESVEHNLRKGPKIQAVKMTCQGERRLRGGVVCQQVMVPATHPIFDRSTPISAISERIGMPLLTHKYPKDKRFTETGDMCNQPVTFMHTDIDPQSTGFGWAPVQWDLQVGNVLLARRDRKALEPEVAEAFGAYCQLHLEAYEQWQGETESEHGKGKGDMRFKDFVLAEVTPKKWALYLEQWKYVRGHGDDEEDAGGVDGLINGVSRMAVTKRDADRILDRLLSLDNPFWAEFGKGQPV
ncbi:hypothetical protein LTR08_000187 [Meristemomyces frigidus]|nr:hypothetical protein LTR08_000187 [Meristemomyces frigidus]